MVQIIRILKMLRSSIFHSYFFAKPSHDLSLFRLMTFPHVPSSPCDQDLQELEFEDTKATKLKTYRLSPRFSPQYEWRRLQKLIRSSDSYMSATGTAISAAVVFFRTTLKPWMRCMMIKIRGSVGVETCGYRRMEVMVCN